MEILLEMLWQVFGEILLQVLAEFLVELGLHCLADPMRKERHPIVSVIGFTLWGLGAGAASLFVLPHSAIANPDLRLANLLVTPVLAGLAMVLVGRVRARRGQDLIRLDRFGYAFLFAFSMALVRFVWAS